MIPDLFVEADPSRSDRSRALQACRGVGWDGLRQGGGGAYLFTEGLWELGGGCGVGCGQAAPAKQSPSKDVVAALL